MRASRPLPPAATSLQEGGSRGGRLRSFSLFGSFQLVDYRVEFSKWWVNEFKTIKFPSQGTIFDYYIDSETKKFMPWTEKVPTFRLDPEVPLQVIPTNCLHLHP